MQTKLHVITNSEMEAWRKCHAFWGFGYADLLRPKVLAAPLSFGRMHHAGCEAGWLAAWSDIGTSRGDRLARARAAAPEAVHQLANQYLAELEETTFPEEVDTNALAEETEEMRDTALWSVDYYFRQAQADLDYVPLMIEASYRVPVPTRSGQGGILANDGVIDLVLWDREQGRIIVQDHKGCKGAVQGLEKRVRLDTQLTGYLLAVRETIRVLQKEFNSPDWPLEQKKRFKTTNAAHHVIASNWAGLVSATTGTVGFNVIRRGQPAVPKLNLLKKGQVVTSAQAALLAEQETDGNPRGEVSVAACDTLPEVYSAALESQFYDRELPVTDKQREVLAKLKARGDTFFTQIEFYKGQDAIDRWRQEVWIDARRMRDAAKRPELRTRNPLACTLPSSPVCPYATVCLAPDSVEARAAFRVAETAHEEIHHEQSEEQDPVNF